MDIILYNILVAILLIIIGYLFGSIPNGIWIGKLFFHKDPRDYGSGNSGGTNVGRVFGKPIGVICIVLDCLKIILPFIVCWAILTYVPMYNGLPLVPSVRAKINSNTSGYLIQWPVYYMTMIGCSLGHCWPIFAGFKGGKNVSSFIGFGWATSWLFGIIPACLYLLFLKWKKMVSVASIATAWVATTLSWIWTILILTGAIPFEWSWIPGYGMMCEFGYVHSLVLTFAATILTLRHSSNIKRILNGTERKITWIK